MPPKSSIWVHFHANRSKYKNNATHCNAWCRYCLKIQILFEQQRDRDAVSCGRRSFVRTEEQLLEEGTALIALPPHVGKLEILKTHLTKNCQHIPAEIKASIVKEELVKNQNPPKTPAVMRSNTLDTELEELSRSKRRKTNPPCQGTKDQSAFEGDVCDWFVACGLPWNAANNPETKKFAEKWLPPDVLIPERRVLSGRILDVQIQKVDARVEKAVRGRLATGQCDGWKNIAKTNVVTTVITVDSIAYLIKTHDMTGEPKTGDRLLELVVDDIEYIMKKYGAIIIAWCTDDGPDGKKMRRLLKAKFPKIFVIVCWAHQINLVVGDLLSLKTEYLDSVKDALKVITWFNNHSAALALLNNEQKITYGQFWALVLPVITRWTAHYLAVNRLFKLRISVRSCAIRHEEALLVCAGRREETQIVAQGILDLVGSERFWRNLEKVRSILEPLAIAANVTQAAHTRLDHVLLTLGNLYRIYSAANNIDLQSQEKILGSLEKRWAKADQDIFIVALFLNPYIRKAIFSPSALTESALYSTVERVFLRVFNRKGDLALLKAFTDYTRGIAEFSDEEMNLQIMLDMFEDEKTPLNLVFIWARIDNQSCSEPPVGRNALTKLAMHVLGVTANSAGCERSFSVFGNIHVKTRNKLTSEKVHKTGALKMDIHRRHVDEGLVSNRKKRVFSVLDAPDHPILGSGANSHTPSPTLLETIVNEAEQSDNDEDLPEPHELLSTLPHHATTQPTPSQIPQQSRLITLKNLFQYPQSSAAASGSGGPGLEDKLAFYWKGGELNLEAELVEYEEDQDVGGEFNPQTADHGVETEIGDLFQ